MLTLAEDLVILAVGAKPRGGPNNGKLSWRFPYGIRGAELVALTLAGRVEVVDGKIVVRDPAPLGDPDLDPQLAGLSALSLPGGVPVGDWMRDTPAGFVSAYFDRLEAAGRLRSETVWLLFIAKRKGYRLVDRTYFENLRGTIRAAVTDAGPADPAVLALAGLLHAGDISSLVFPGHENAPVRARLAELAGPDLAVRVGPAHDDGDDPLRRASDQAAHHALQHAVQAAALQHAVQAAMHASVHAAVSAASISSHHHSGSSSGGDSSSSHHHG
jgi:hypothetical protein